MAVNFKRILHPIGQGAFFTEHFYDADTKECVFNVVYDCGSFTSGKKNAPPIIKNEIDITYTTKEHIDLLFISHFDGDHTNGLEYLLEKTEMDENTYVFIPFHISLMLAAEKRSPIFDNFIEQAVNNNVHFIRIRSSESLTSLNRIEPTTVEALNGESTTRELLISAFSVASNPIWYYLPFMAPDVNKFEADFLSEAKAIDGLDLDVVQSVIEHKNELKQVYKRIGESKYKNTKINTNSLFLLSFPAKGTVNKCHFWVDSRFFTDYCSWGYQHNFNLTASCLYTGDSSLKCDNSYKEIVSSSSDILNRYSDSTKIGIMQIPHHGSINCYPEEIAEDDRIISAFANFQPYYSQRIFYTDIIRKFSNMKPLFLITDKYSTRLEIYADISQPNGLLK